MICLAVTFNIEAMSETERLSLYARIFALLIGNQHCTDEQAQMILSSRRCAADKLPCSSELSARIKSNGVHSDAVVFL